MKGNFKRRWFSFLVWTLISAAFVGPGTVTTAAVAGHSSAGRLLLFLLPAGLACFALQEGAARIFIIKGKNLGQAIAELFSKGKQALWLRRTLALSIALGCAAYEGGNISGGLEGLRLLLGNLPAWSPLLFAALASCILYPGKIVWIARIMAMVVAMMALSFCLLIISHWDLLYQLHDSGWVAFIKPDWQPSYTWMILGLIGTTIVPYNLFLGSGLGKGQGLSEMRFGLLAAIAAGILISMAILLCGALVQGPFDFEALAVLFENQMGKTGPYILGIGLAAAGFSSALTAPFAAGITLHYLWPEKSIAKAPNEKSIPAGVKYSRMESLKRNFTDPFTLAWMLVLGLGTLFSSLAIKPIPLILFAQGLNGFLLPFVCAFLILCLHHPYLLPSDKRNGWPASIALICVFYISVWLGSLQLLQLLQPYFPQTALEFKSYLFLPASILSLILIRQVHRQNQLLS